MSAKIVRYNGDVKAFAVDAVGSERTIFGEVTQANDLTSQINADYLRGWGIVGPADEPSLQDFNAMGFALGQFIAYLHQVGVAEYNSAQEYHANSFVNSGGILYVSLINSNIGNTPVSSPTQWKELYGQATETVRGTGTVATQAEAEAGSSDTDLMTPLKVKQAIMALTSPETARVDVASASTVNLTTAAPNTRDINITGTTTITAFTLVAGRRYFVRFAGSLILTNNANIVTQSGANLITAAGDTCILRATAANTVEVLCYTPFKSQAVGSYQTWQNLTASRAAATNYTNSTGKPIQVAVRSGTAAPAITVDGVAMDAGSGTLHTVVVPSGSVYNLTTGTLVSWYELR